MQIWDNYDLRYVSTLSYFCSNNAKTMELKTGEFPDLEMSPVASMRTCSPMQFATIATTLVICHKDTETMVYLLEVCGYSIFATRPVPVAQDRYRTRTRPVLKITTRPVPAGIPVPVTVKPSYA